MTHDTSSPHPIGEAPLDAGAAPHRGGLRPSVLARLLRLIENRLHEPLHVEDLAVEACLSPFHFARMFKQSTGLTPHGYLTARRLQRARDLLVDPNLLVRDVSRLAGFSTQAHFCAVFRAALGVTPGAYRRRLREQALQEGEAASFPPPQHPGRQLRRTPA